MDQKLIDFVKEELGKGADVAEIRKSLLVAGWSDSEIEKAFSLAASVEPEPAPEAAQAPAAEPLAQVVPDQPNVKPLVLTEAELQAEILSQVSEEFGQPIESIATESAKPARFNIRKRMAIGLAAILLVILIAIGGAAAYFYLI